MSNISLDQANGLETSGIAPEVGIPTAWGARGFLFDMNSSLYVLREQMTQEIGQEFTADILYRAGYAGAAALAEYIILENPTDEGLPRLAAALDHLSKAGYAELSLDKSRWRPGEVRIKAVNSAEASVILSRAGQAGYACDYLRGLLRGLVEGLPPTSGFPSGELECVETTCMANDDPDCHFLIATASHMAEHGYRQGGLNHSSVRETLLRLNRQLEDVLEAATRDVLTGLFNRAHFESVLRRKIEHAKRRTDTLAVAMIDLDGFKEVNDAMGHAMGDLALRQVGHLLGAQARETDLVARYGGDEFAWLMPGTTVDAAVAVADRIRRLVQEMRQEMDLPISLSIGIASCPEDAASMTDLIDFADVAMYQAKESGGNQVRHYIATKDERDATRRRSRNSRPRPAAGPIDLPIASEDNLPRLDLED